jgi:protein involved in polysaccharide export with SLBB domain
VIANLEELIVQERSEKQKKEINQLLAISDSRNAKNKRCKCGSVIMVGTREEKETECLGCWFDRKHKEMGFSKE